jgi:hypothetical protein
MGAVHRRASDAEWLTTGIGTAATGAGSVLVDAETAGGAVGVCSADAGRIER